MSMVRLYGRMSGWSSQAVVSRGFSSALRSSGVLEGVVDVSSQDGLEVDPTPGALARDAIFTAQPGSVGRMGVNSRHRRRFGMLVPNSNLLPKNLVTFYEQTCTDLLSPSDWGAEVLRLHSKLPVHVVPHGVHEAFVVDPTVRARVSEAFREGWWTILHSSTTDRQRKGTIELIRAWGIADIPRERTRLMLLLDPEAHRGLREAMFEMKLSFPPGIMVKIRQGLGMPPIEMAEFLSVFHGVCQPSRGEGFGLVPLEARACGVPVIATACTGHAQHLADAAMDDGVVVIPHDEPCPIDDLPGSMAPSVKPTDIAKALTVAYSQWLPLHEAAMSRAADVAEKWSWSNQLAPFIKENLQ